MKHFVGMFAVLVVLWLLLSSHFQLLMLGFGLASALLTLYVAHRMDVASYESYSLRFIFRLPKFFLLLFREIVKANIDVAQRALGLKSISPTIIHIPVPHRTDLGRVIYANSITLTPGTTSIDVSSDWIVVHALSEEGAESLKQGYLASIIPEVAHWEDTL